MRKFETMISLIMVVCGVNQDGYLEVLAIESMPDASKETYDWLFQKLQKRGLKVPKLIISDAYKDLTAAITKNMLRGNGCVQLRVMYKG